jgi:hypothetical protein
MNLIYKRRRVLKSNCKKVAKFTRKVLDCLFGQSYHQIASAEAFINDILYQSIYLFKNNFGSNGEGYIRFALCVKEEKYKRPIDFCFVIPTKEVLNSSRIDFINDKMNK